MALYDGAHYRVGYQGYIRVLAQSSVLVPPTQITDPTVSAGTSLGDMLAQLPAWQQTENLTEIESVGSMRDVEMIPGRRECTVQTQILVSNGAWLSNETGNYVVVRNHAAPASASNLRNGLQLVTVEVGAAKGFGSGAARYGVDALCQSFNLQMNENQPVSAQVEFWPIAFVPVPSGAEQDRHPYPTGFAAQPLVWRQIQWFYGTTDLKPLLDSATFSVANNLNREGARAMIMGAPGELAISRTAFTILPGLEKIRVTFRLKDDLPEALRTSADWGKMMLYAVQDGTGAGRCELQVTIKHSRLNRRGMDQGQAGQPIRFTAEPGSYEVSIRAGLTGA